MSKSKPDLTDLLAVHLEARLHATAARARWLWLARVCGWLLGGVFLYAGLSKVADPAAFAVQIRNYQFAPWWMVHPAALLLPWIEIVAGLLLVVGVWTLEATIMLSVLLVSFLVAIGWAMHQGLDIDCGCFAGHTRIGPAKLLEDILLLLLAAVGIVARRRSRRARP
jgi:putative oxidoreductase